MVRFENNDNLETDHAGLDGIESRLYLNNQTAVNCFTPNPRSTVIDRGFIYYMIFAISRKMLYLSN